jgi:hypothetical protein
MWDADDVTRAFVALGQRVQVLTREFLSVFGEGEAVPTAATAARLRRLNLAAKDLVAEGKRHVRDAAHLRQMSSFQRELSGDTIDDRVLDAVIASALKH